MIIAILFSKNNSPLSRAIRWITKSPVSHVSIQANLFDIPLVMEATLLGVRMVERSKWADDNELVESYRVEVLESSFRWALLALNERYDVLGLLGFIPVMVGRSLGLLWRNPLVSPSATVCSELVTRVLHVTPGFFDVDPEQVTPEDLRRICKEYLGPSLI